MHTSDLKAQTPFADVLPPHASPPSATMQYSPSSHWDSPSASGPTSHVPATTSAAAVVVGGGGPLVAGTATRTSPPVEVSSESPSALPHSPGKRTLTPSAAAPQALPYVLPSHPPVEGDRWRRNKTKRGGECLRMKNTTWVRLNVNGVRVN